MSAGNDREFIDDLQKKEGGKAMKCPLLWSACLMSHRRVKEKDGDCLKEECAWWDAPLKRCHLVAISLRLGAIFEQLSGIQVKMPHSGQFLQKP